MAYTFDENIVSDLHKDARGFRPTSGWWNVWKDLSDDAKQETWDSLCQELSETMERERAAEARAILEFQARICETRALGAATDEEAVRWILEGEGFDDIDYCYGADYCAYHFGLAYNNPYRELFARVCAAKAKWQHQEEAA